MLPYQFRAWTTEDLANLLLARPSKGKQIDYKQELPKDAAATKGKSPDLEFLEDVAAFANSIDGVILYGVIEDGGRLTARGSEHWSRTCGAARRSASSGAGGCVEFLLS